MGHTAKQEMGRMVRTKLALASALLLALVPLKAGQAEPIDEAASRVDTNRAHIDIHGDPLPPHAWVRMGSARFHHPGGASHIAFSPDGKFLVSSANGNAEPIRLWEAATGIEVRTLQVPRDCWPAALTFLPDARTLVAGCLQTKRPGALIDLDDTIRLLDVSTGQEIRTMTGYHGSVQSVAVSPDGKTLASADREGVIRLWDVGTGRQIHARPGRHAVAFSPDGKTLASGGEAIRLWDVATGQEIRRFGRFAEETDQGSLVFSPDGKTLVSGDAAGARLWDVATGKEMRRWARGRPYVAALLSPDGKTLAWAGTGGQFVLADVATGKDVHTLKGNLNGFRAVAFSPDSKNLASATGDGSIVLYNVASGAEILPWMKKDIRPWMKHEAPVTDLAFSPDGKVLATGGDGPSSSQNAAIRLWEVATGKGLHLLTGSAGQGPLAFSPDGRTVATLDAKNRRFIQMWDVDTGKQIRTLSMDTGKRNRSSWDLIFAADGRTLLGVNGDSEICSWDPGTGREVGNVMLGKQRGEAEGEKIFAPNGKIVATVLASNVSRLGYEPNTIWLWNVATGQEIAALEGHTHQVSALSFSSDGQRLVSGDSDGTIRLWDAASGKQVRLWRAAAGGLRYSPVRSLRYPIGALALAPDGKTLASTGGDTIRLWEVLTGQRIRTFSGHCGDTQSLAFAPDGKKLASGSTDKTVLVWRVFGESPRGDRLTAEELLARWTDLSGEDAACAYRAVDALQGASHQSVPFLRQRLPKPDTALQGRLVRLIADLERDEFAARQKATDELEALGDLAELSLLQALDSKPPLEKRRRLELLIEKAIVPSAEQLRWLRAIQVLELIGSPDVKSLLESLAREAPMPRLRREAAAALERLARRR
jgi:WD40 repeat protein